MVPSSSSNSGLPHSLFDENLAQISGLEGLNFAAMYLDDHKADNVGSVTSTYNDDGLTQVPDNEALDPPEIRVGSSDIESFSFSSDSDSSPKPAKIPQRKRLKPRTNKNEPRGQTLGAPYVKTEREFNRMTTYKEAKIYVSRNIGR